MPNNKYTLEGCKQIAQQYTELSKFRKDHMKVYKACLHNGWKDEVCAHMSKKTGRGRQLTDEQVLEIAANYDNMAELQRGDSSAYQVLRRRGLLDKAKESMNCRIRHTKEGIRQEALKYNTRREFELGSFAHYRAAHRRGIIDEVCEHMELQQSRPYTEEELIQMMESYDSRIAFQKANGSAYQAALRLDLIHHIPTLRDEEKTEEGAHAEAAKYESREDFKNGSSDWWFWCRKRPGMMTKVCSHMLKPLCNRFSRSGWQEFAPNGSWLYLVKIDEDHCKAGITSRTPQCRLKELPKGSKLIRATFLEDSGLIYDMEKEMLDILRENYEPYPEADWSGCKETFKISQQDIIAIYHSLDMICSPAS